MLGNPAQQASAQASVQAARDRVAADAAQLTRGRRLYTEGVAALKDVQAAKSQLAANRAAISLAGPSFRAPARSPPCSARRPRRRKRARLLPR